jgi:pimeloyl-ACP methyl ester carboxylesterase
MAELVVRRHLIPNHDGWRLAVKQTFAPERLRRGWRPLVIVPGYGMNSFIFGYHPRGRSMEAYLAESGFEVWSLNLRGQGESERFERDKGSGSGFRDLALTDLGASVRAILRLTETTCDRVDAIGCSLGATLVFIYAALTPDPRLGAIVSAGGALRLDEVHPAVRLLGLVPDLVGLVPVTGIRPLARKVLPLLVRLPWLMSIYIHPRIIDMSKANELARTVESPNRELNREIALWIRAKDVVLDGRNVTEEFAGRVRVPLLSVVANGDGVVPRASALSAHERGRMEVREVLEVGTQKVPIAHADLFVSDYAESWFFQPMGAWLVARQAAESGRPKG